MTDRVGKQFKTRVVFIALDAFDRPGGMQRFNLRVIQNLALLVQQGQIEASHTLLLKDEGKTASAPPAEQVTCFSSRRVPLIASAFKSSWNASHLIIGQINLLPIGFLLKLIRPRLTLLLFVHGIEVWGEPRYRRPRWYEPFLLKSVDIVASVSEYTAKRMRSAFHLSASVFRPFPNAVDPSLADLPYNTDGGILCVSRMAEHDREKNIDVLIKALAVLKHKFNSNLILTLIGDGKLRDELATLADELDVASNVRFLGRVDEATLENEYRNASVFALPSDKEGFGIVYLEAWRFGLPVICGSGGAAHEVVSDGIDGYVVDSANPEAVADRLLKLISDPEKAAEMGREGRKKTITVYSDSEFRGRLSRLLDVQTF